MPAPVTAEQWAQLMSAVVGQVHGPKDTGDTPPAAPAITQAASHQPVLTPEQAAAFRTLMFIQGHTGDTVGRGQVIPLPPDPTEPHEGDANGEGQHRQVGGPEGDGNASSVAPLGPPDPGAGSLPAA